MEKLDIPEKQPYEGKATQKQKQLIWDLGFDDQEVIDQLGKQQASCIIDELVFIQTKIADVAFYKKRVLRWLAGVILFLVMAATGKVMNELTFAPSIVVWGYILSFCCFVAVIKNTFKMLKVKIRRK